MKCIASTVLVALAASLQHDSIDAEWPTLQTLLRKEQVLFPLPTEASSGSVNIQAGFLPGGCSQSTFGKAASACQRFNLLVQGAGGFHTDTDIDCGDTDVNLSYDIDESYKLEVNDGDANGWQAGKVKIKAQNWVGCLRAITTLTGLVENDGQGNSGDWTVPNGPWNITDSPVYRYRGVLVDTSRHWQSPKSLTQLIDQMSIAKLNALHLHLTDTGGWSFNPTPAGEEDVLGLSNAGVRPGMVYSTSVMKAIVTYAEARGVSIVPEIDSPGHAAPGIPEHLVRCTGVEQSTSTYGLQAPVAQYEIGPDKINVTAQWFAEVWQKTKDIFPNMPWMHIGADEVNVPCMVLGTEHEGKDAAEAKAIVDTWQSDWITRMQNVASDLGVSAALWQDGYLNHQTVEVAAETVLSMWDYNSGNEERKARLIAACQKGTKLIQSRYQTYYLDCGGANWLIGQDTSWCQHSSWQRIALESLAGDLPDECQDNVIGGQVQLWSETINDYNLLTKAFPRAWAMAERLWSNGTTFDVKPRKQHWDSNFWEDKNWGNGKEAEDLWIPVLDRLRVLQNNQDQQGLASKPIQPESCDVHPELCNVWTRSFR